jgi:hypothetical protein
VGFLGKKMKTLITIILLISCAQQVQEVEPIKVESKCQLFEKNEIWYYLDSFSQMYNVNPDFIYDIGRNESGWRKDDDTSYVLRCFDPNEQSFGDLQVNIRLLEHYGQVSDTSSRIKLLEVGIKRLAELMDKYQDFQKVRFVYARGHWRPRHRWTTLEAHFMGRMNWNDYTF